MMGRVKTRMEFITSDKKRKSVFETRSNCIKKKARELSTLCAVNVGLIVTHPTTSEMNMETYAWPDNKGDRMLLLDDMITRYKSQDLVKRQRRNTNVESFLGSDETRQYPTSKLDSKFETMSEQELRKLATFLDSKVEEAKERILYLKKGKQAISSTSANQPDLIVIDDENKDENLFPMNRPEVVDIDSDDDGDDLTYMLQQILDNPMTPATDDLPSHDSAEDFGIPWSDDLPLLVDPTTNSYSTDISYPINMQSGLQPIVTAPDFQPEITQYPNEVGSLSYYLNKPPPQYFDAPIFCQPLEPHINTSSISNLNFNSSVWNMPLLS